MHHIHPSSLDRRRHCPGSKAAEKGIEDQSNEAAESGTRIHAALDSVINAKSVLLDDINAYAEEVAERHNLDENETFITTWFARIVQASIAEAGGAAIIEKEVPVSYMIADGIELTGTVDLRVWMNNGELHIWDYKTGRAQQATADMHTQIQAYSVATFEALTNADGTDTAATAITAHIVAAGNDPDERHTYSTFNAEYLEAYKQDVYDIATAACDPDAPRRPGWPQCQYCKARGTQKCGESRAYLERFNRNVQKMDDVTAVFGDQTPAQRCETLDYTKAVKAIADRIEKAAKAGLKADEGYIDKWSMSADTTSKEIADTLKAIEILETEAGLDRDTIIAGAKLSRSSIATAYHHAGKAIAEATGEKPITKASASTMVDSYLKPVLREKTRSGSLRREKE